MIKCRLARATALIVVIMMIGGCKANQLNDSEISESVLTQEDKNINDLLVEDEVGTIADLNNDKPMDLQVSMIEQEQLLWEQLLARVYYVTYLEDNENPTEVVAMSLDNTDTAINLLNLIIADDLFSIPISSFDPGTGIYTVAKTDIVQLMQNIVDIDLSGYTEADLDEDLYQVSVGDYGDGYPDAFFTSTTFLNNGDIELKGYAGMIVIDATATSEGLVLNPNNQKYLAAQPFTAHLKPAELPIYTQYSLRDFKWQ